MAGDKAKVIPLHPDSGRPGSRNAQRIGAARRHPSAASSSGHDENIQAVIREFEQRRSGAEAGPSDLVARIAGLADGDGDGAADSAEYL